MKNIVISLKIATIVFIAISILSCRESADDLQPYNKYDEYIFYDSELSYEGQFKAIWTALNCNYSLWDYEAEFGLDWDAVYEKYLPVFQEYDDREEVVPDKEFKQTYKAILQPLHDGHFYAYIKNKDEKTGKMTGSQIGIQPSAIRNKEDLSTRRKDTDDPFTSLFYYKDNSLIAEDSIEYEIDIPNLRIVHYSYCLFTDNIAYLRLPSFDLTEKLANGETEYFSIWNIWFNKVMELHAEGKLKGVIIDLRNNPGGNRNNFQYGIGALYPSSQPSPLHIGYIREKNGVGRLDYGGYAPDLYPNFIISDVLLPYLEPIFVNPNGVQYESIREEPIVVLANGNSASLAESTCLATKNIENATFIGMRTYGALSPLSDDHYSAFYSGQVGNVNKGSFYLNIPNCVHVTDNIEILEGVGVAPDIEVELDVQLYEETGRDTQLERALEYIRTGK